MTGTIKEFISKKVLVNDKERDGLFWHWALRMGEEIGACKKVGEQKQVKGRAAIIWSIPAPFDFKL